MHIYLLIVRHTISYTEAASQEAAGAGGQGSMVPGSCWPYHRIRSFRMKAPACDTVLHHPYIAENVTEPQ